MSGLRQLPRVQIDRKRMFDEGDRSAMDHMDCTACKQRFDDVIRAEWRCGWMPREQHRPGAGVVPHSEEVCPGYVISLPEVIEAAHLLQWRDAGSLAAVVEELPLPQIAVSSVNILAGSVREAEAELFRRRKEEDHGSG